MPLLIAAIVASPSCSRSPCSGSANLGVYVVLGVITWAALLTSGVDPVVAGLAIGLHGAGVLARAGGARAGERAVPAVPGAADTGARAVGDRRPDRDDLAERTTPVPLPPVDQLPDRPAVRPRQRRCHDRRGIPRPGLHLAGHARHPDRLRGRQTGRGHARSPGCSTASSGGRIRPQVGWAAVAGSGTIAGIGFTVSLLIATIAFDGPALAEAKIGLLSAVVVSAAVTWAVFRSVHAAQSAEEGARAARSGRGAGRPRRSGRPRDRPRPRSRDRLGDARRVRRLRVPVLRDRGGRRTGSVAGRRPAVRVAASAADRRASAGADRGRGGRGRARAGGVLGDARPAARQPGEPAAQGPDVVRRGARPRQPNGSTTT